MRKFLLAASVATFVLASPALAQKGGHGGGHDEKGGGQDGGQSGGQGGAKSAKAERGGGGERGGEGQAKMRDAEPRAAKYEQSRGPEKAMRDDRSKREDRPMREAKADRRDDRKADRKDDRNDRGNDRDEARNFNSRDNGFTGRYADDNRGDRGRDLIDGCPPGLAAKNNGCLPPGQLKKMLGQRLPDQYSGSLLPSYYRNYYPDSDQYFYRTGNDGLLYRIARSSGLIDGYSPLFGYGERYPNYYQQGDRYPLDSVSFYNVPAAYQPFYQDQDDWLYRYGDGGIYRVNRSNGLVDGLVALLAGDLGVGQQLPSGYDVYNVPFAYRDRYADSDDSWYRYNDGNIYQVDPKTRLIQAVIAALV